MGQGTIDADGFFEGQKLHREVRELLTEPSRSDIIRAMKRMYTEAEQSNTRENIICPNCATEHEKTTYHKKFCSTRCKDQYWNTVDEERQDRAQKFK